MARFLFEIMLDFNTIFCFGAPDILFSCECLFACVFIVEKFEIITRLKKARTWDQYFAANILYIHTYVLTTKSPPFAADQCSKLTCCRQEKNEVGDAQVVAAASSLTNRTRAPATLSVKPHNWFSIDCLQTDAQLILSINPSKDNGIPTDHQYY